MQACDGPECCTVDTGPAWMGTCTYNLDLKVYEGECTGCEPCTAECNADAVIGAGGSGRANEVDPLFLQPCTLGNPNQQMAGDCIFNHCVGNTCRRGLGNALPPEPDFVCAPGTHLLEYAAEVEVPGDDPVAKQRACCVSDKGH